jgi:serine/threonine protein kinase
LALTPGTRIGPYEVLSSLGAGGMGEVYRARDTKLNRDVALKILSESFVLDADRLARFRREAQSSPRSITRTSLRSMALKTQARRMPLVLELVEGPDARGTDCQRLPDPGAA